MEDKRLNFNQPLLSVRRPSSTIVSVKDEKRRNDNSIPNIPRLPSYKSELKSGPIRNAGTVPFVWEQIPGRPKGDSKPRNYASEKPPIVPKLPPGRILKPKHPKEDSDNVSQNSSSKNDPTGPVLLMDILSSPRRVKLCDENVTRTDMPKHTRKDIRKEGNSDSGEGDEEYLDALDMLSRTDSTLLNCSVSGVSGLDGPDSTLNGSVPTDPQARDFMMGRFLPAAKAMASETPQHAPRKQPVAWQNKPRDVKKVANGAKQTPLRYGSSYIRNYTQESNEEESDDAYEDHAELAGNICGLIPKFCLKGSVGFLNPVPAMSMRTRAPMSHVSRSHVSSSSTGSCSEIENEVNMVANNEQQSKEKITMPHEDTSSLKNNPKKTYSEETSHEIKEKIVMPHEDTSSLKNNPKKKYSEETSHEIKGSKLYSRLQGSDKSPSHKEHPLTFQELLALPNWKGEMETETGNPMVEKTLYVDTIHKVELPKQNHFNAKGMDILRDNNSKFLAKAKIIENNSTVVSLLKGTENLSIAYEEENLLLNVKKPIDIHQDLSTSKASNPEFSEADKVENSNEFEAEFPVPPPLPKSPSDSWLWRTLPSVSSKNPTSRSYNGTRNKAVNWASNTSDTKSKGFAKITKGQHQHFRYSKDLLVPIPET